MSDLAFFTARGIETKRLPDWVLTKAAGIVTKLEAGENFQTLGGKRLKYDHAVIAIPVGIFHRLLAREENGRLVIKKLLTHEDYNKYTRKVRI